MFYNWVFMLIHSHDKSLSQTFCFIIGYPPFMVLDVQKWALIQKRVEIGQLIFALFGTMSHRRVFTRRILKLIVIAILKYLILKVT